TLGRKANEFFRRRNAPIVKDYSGVFTHMHFGVANDIAQEIAQRYLTGEIDGAFLVYNEFVSAISQRVQVVEMLPMAPPSPTAEEPAIPVEYLYEPERSKVL